MQNSEDISRFEEVVLKAVNPKGYKLHGTIDMQDLHIKVENRKGSVRSGVDPDGNKWSIKMKYPYGYISRTKAADDEHVDCYVGDDRKSDKVFIIHQVDPKTGKYDEDKVMLGFKTAKEAKQVYLDHYDSPKFFGSMITMTMDKFKESLKKYKGMKLKKAIEVIGDDRIHTPEEVIVLNELVKGVDKSQLVQKKVWVTRGGKVFQQTIWVREGDESATPNQSKNIAVGGTIAEDVGGMNIKRYSDKAVLISGDTYANKETLQKIKKEVGVGSYNAKLKGWVFPVKALSRVLAGIVSSLKDKGEDAKSETIKNQKNALDEGTNVSLGDGLQGEVSGVTPTSDGTKYDIKTTEGVLKGVSEEVVSKGPETDPKKISETLNGANESNRVKTEKVLYGIKPVKDLHKISLYDYLEMHGISQGDIYKVVRSLTNPSKEKKSSGGGGGSSKPKGGDVSKTEGLTKRQLISKLVYAHYQAVSNAIELGIDVDPNVLSTYPDLKKKAGDGGKKTEGPKKEESKPKKQMTEETKRKISEALKKNGVDDEEVTDKELKEQEEVKSQTGFDSENFKPKDGKTFKIEKSENSYGDIDAEIKTKDYTEIPATELSIPSPKKIMSTPRPYWVPEIDPEQFKRNGYTIDAIKIGEDQYLVALDGFTKGGGYMLNNKNINVNGNFAVMSLDHYAATVKYYQTLAKASWKQEQDAKIEQQKENLRSRGIDPEKYRYSKKRIKILTQNQMTRSQSFMIQSMTPKDSPIRENRQWYWKVYREQLAETNQKSIDLDLQAEYVKSAYTKGAETSYGDKGTKDDLLSEYGVKVKRQNGDEIKPEEVKDIKNALDSVAKVFGKNKQMNKEFGLKISHSGDVLMHARKAVGLFHPFYNAIGVSAIAGDDQFKFTFGHEYAHFMDYWVGKGSGHHFASDKQGSTANEIARTFRKNMNIAQSSNYQNRTCECFARALEQYHAYEAMGSEVYFTEGNHVNKEVYEKQLKPLIEKFLKENKQILKDILSNIVIFEAQKLK